MKKFFVLIAAALLGVSAFAAAPVDPVARTESMTKKLGLNDRQARKVYRLNLRYSDVLGEEITLGRPIYGDSNGPYYDTPGRPHPSGNNGVPGSWSKNPDGAPNVGPAVGVAPVQVEPMDPKVAEKLAKRRAKYEKKLARILTPEQFTEWKEGQKPFVVR